MKPGSGDKPYPLLIEGRELAELQKFTWHMAEAFGLDRRIRNYKGTRPLRLYRWDLDCLEAATSLALDDKQEYPGKSGKGYEAMLSLHEKIKRLWAQAYDKTGEKT